MPPQLSVLLPAYNEAENLAELVPEICETLEAAQLEYEVVVVDDGSTDDTRAVMGKLRSEHVRWIRLRRNSGKSAALQIGIDQLEGEFVALMDADGQDEPKELPRLLNILIERDLDLVTGRRSVRNDRVIKRTTSKLYNGATTWVTGVKGRDFNSGLKVMRCELATSIELYGELHRYIPVLAVWNGFQVDEIDVEHHERRHGSSKFGTARFWRGFLDLVTVKFLTTYTARPFHLFGGIGFGLGALGGGLLSWMAISHLMGNKVGTRPALATGILLVVVAVQMISLGLLGELMVNLRRRRTLDATAFGDLR